MAKRKVRKAKQPTNHNQQKQVVVVNIHKNNKRGRQVQRQPQRQQIQLPTIMHSFGPADSIQTQLLMDLSQNLRQIHIQAPHQIAQPSFNRVGVPVEPVRVSVSENHNRPSSNQGKEEERLPLSYHNIPTPKGLHIVNDMISTDRISASLERPHLSPTASSMPSSSSMSQPIRQRPGPKPRGEVALSAENIDKLTLVRLRMLAREQKVSIPNGMKVAEVKSLLKNAIGRSDIYSP
jgi:hypothetical protein